MRTVPSSSTVSTLGLLAGLAAVAACSSTRNVEQRQKAAEIEGTAGASAIPTTAREYIPPCINTCAPDPLLDEYLENPTSDADGILADCAKAEKDVELYPGSFMDMEDHEEDGVFRASNFYSYDDKTTFTLVPSGWQPNGIEMRRCREDKANYDEPSDAIEELETRNHVLHVSGGPFVEWGGGIGRALKCFNRNGLADFRTLVDTATGAILTFDPAKPAIAQDEACGFAPSAFPCNLESSDLVNSICPERDLRQLHGEEVPADEEFLLGAALDFSQWDGISFWARRSPNSQAAIRVAIADKYVDDDLRWLQEHISPDQEPYCQIKRECHCPEAGTTCMDIKYINKDTWRHGSPFPPNVDMSTLSSAWFCATKEDEERGYVLEVNSTRCGGGAGQENTTMCNYYHETWQKSDVNFYDKPCTEYALRGSIVEAYCFDPETDPPPPEDYQICGDHWMKPVRLSTEWAFYKVPFTELLQQGWAMESHQLDLTSVGTIRFTWDRGYIDYWLDDVRLYRNTR